MKLWSTPPARTVWGMALSLLALCSALMAPASVLARQMSEGKWSALCSVAAAPLPSADGQAAAADDHCPLCLLPALALPTAPERFGAGFAAAARPFDGAAGFDPAPQERPPQIRGPPRRL